MDTDDVTRLSTATTAQGSGVAIRVADGRVLSNHAQIASTDIEATNGIIHVIDTVVLPAS